MTPPSLAAGRPFALALFVVLVAAAAPVAAQKTVQVTGSFVHLDPRSSSGPLRLSEVAGQPLDMPQADTGVRVLQANTTLISAEYFFTPAVSLQGTFGVPPKYKLEGTGVLAAFGVIGESLQSSPTALLKYHWVLGRFEPYVGIGANRTWFTRARITNDVFRATFYGPSATTNVSASSSWNPVYQVGFDYPLTERVTLGASVAYAPVSTRITVAADQTSMGVAFKVITDVRVRTLASALSVGFRF